MEHAGNQAGSPLRSGYDIYHPGHLTNPAFDLRKPFDLAWIGVAPAPNELDVEEVEPKTFKTSYYGDITMRMLGAGHIFFRRLYDQSLVLYNRMPGPFPDGMKSEMMYQELIQQRYPIFVGVQEGAGMGFWLIPYHPAVQPGFLAYLMHELDHRWQTNSVGAGSELGSLLVEGKLTHDEMGALRHDHFPASLARLGRFIHRPANIPPPAPAERSSGGQAS